MVYTWIVFTGVLGLTFLCSEIWRARQKRLLARRMQHIQRQEQASPAPQEPHPGFRTLIQWIEGWVAFPTQARWRDKLVQAGWQGRLRPGEFLLLRGLLMLLLPTLGGFCWSWASPDRKWLLLGIGGLLLLGYAGPWLLLEGAILRRRRRVARALPHALDLLLACMEAGLGFEGALQQVAQRTCGLLSEEFQAVLEDMKQGKSRPAAWRRLKERTNLPALNSLANAIIQTSQLELSLKDILRAQAYLVHRRRREWVESQARKLPFRTLSLLVLLTLLAVVLLFLCSPARGPGVPTP